MWCHRWVRVLRGNLCWEIIEEKMAPRPVYPLKGAQWGRVEMEDLTAFLPSGRNLTKSRNILSQRVGFLHPFYIISMFVTTYIHEHLVLNEATSPSLH